MCRLDGRLAGAVAVCILFLVAAGVEAFELARRFFRRAWPGFKSTGSREGQDGYTFV